jgi:hypothetical protein
MYWNALQDLNRGTPLPVPAPHPKFNLQVCFYVHKSHMLHFPPWPRWRLHRCISLGTRFRC